jgi:hypothetical protein
MVFDRGSRSPSLKFRGACFGVFLTHVESGSMMFYVIDLKKNWKIRFQKTLSKTREQVVLRPTKPQMPQLRNSQRQSAQKSEIW